jgi:transposase
MVIRDRLWEEAAMRAYSNDLRERIVAAVERGDHSLRQLAQLFAVSLSFIVRLLQRKRRTNSVQPEPHAGGTPRKLDADALARLRQLVREQPDATLAELRARLGVCCSLATLCRALQRQRLTRKKKTLHADERDAAKVQAQRTTFDHKMATVEPAHLVFVDEMGTNTAQTRTYGRAPAGERVRASAPGHWENITLIAGLRPAGVVAPFAFAGAADQQAFRTYVQQGLVPILQEGDVVVWDNLRLHQDAVVCGAIQAAGAAIEPLPIYSPDKAPIEEMFSKVKGYLRTPAARTTATVITALGAALDRVTTGDIIGWFHHRCPYTTLA